MFLKDISNFFGTISLQSVDTTLTDVNFIHHALEILNDGVKSCLMVLNHSVINLKQILLYSSISQHLLIEIVNFYEICQLLHSKGRIKQYYDMHALLLPIFIQKFWFFWWTQQTTRTHCISWCCLYYGKEINVLRLQSSQDTKCCFFGRKKQRHHLLI